MLTINTTKKQVLINKDDKVQSIHGLDTLHVAVSDKALQIYDNGNPVHLYSELFDNDIILNGEKITSVNAARKFEVLFKSEEGSATHLWKPDFLWEDIKTKVETDQDVTIRLAVVIADVQKTINIDASKLGNSSARYVTHYGELITPGTEYAWDLSQDIADSSGVKTRALYIYSADKNVSIDVASYDVLYVYGNNCYITRLFGGNYNQVPLANNSLQAVKFGQNTKAAANAVGGGVSFNLCHSLVSIDIPAGVTSLGRFTFYNCYSLKEVNLPQELLNIEDNVFNACYSLREVNIPQTVTDIANGAFNSCYSLMDLRLPHISVIKQSTFQNCRSLTELRLPEGINSIDANAFAFCYSLQHIIIPMSVNAIDSNAFWNCFALRYIEIPQDYILPNNLSLTSSIRLSYSAIIDFFTKLGDTPNSVDIQLPAAVYNRLTDDDKLIVTTKGYTLTSA